MRKGRGRLPGHDHKSVDFPSTKPTHRTTMDTQRLLDQTERLLARYSTADFRVCSGPCKQTLHVSAFDSNETHGDVQSYCMQCKDGWELTPGAIYSRMREVLKVTEPQTVPLWTFDRFKEKWQQSNGVCFYSGAGLRKYQKGRGSLTIDRIDNDLDHSPDNVVLCCYPANIHRRTTEFTEYCRAVHDLRQRSPHNTSAGAIWNVIDAGWKVVQRRTTGHLAALIQTVMW